MRRLARQVSQTRQYTSSNVPTAIQPSTQHTSDLSTLCLSNVFPDASATAAGVRTISLLERWSTLSTVHFATGSQAHKRSNAADASPPQDITEYLESQGITWSFLPPNRSDLLSSFTQSFPKLDTIVYDRFYVEEAYSFALQEYYPDAAFVTDMQDMHSLRWGREELVRQFDKQDSSDPLAVLEQVVHHQPTVDNPHLIRELASIHRSDLTLVCSPYEMEILKSVYQVPPDKLALASFFVPEALWRPLPSPDTNPEAFEAAPTFVFCGGFKHSPNLDAARLLLRHIWPKIHKALPKASLHIHGAYCPQEILQAHQPKKGVIVHGFTPELQDVFVPGSILLAPLRFGAGIKGKIVDAWMFGLPVVTTPIGSEGMTDCQDTAFGGRVAFSIQQFVEDAIGLATDSSEYHRAQKSGRALLGQLYDDDQNWKQVEASIQKTKDNLLSRRKSDNTRAMLWHHSARSTEYFSRWIELKEKMQRDQQNHKYLVVSKPVA